MLMVWSKIHINFVSSCKVHTDELNIRWMRMVWLLQHFSHVESGCQQRKVSDMDEKLPWTKSTCGLTVYWCTNSYIHEDSFQQAIKMREDKSKFPKRKHTQHTIKTDKMVTFCFITGKWPFNDLLMQKLINILWTCH